MHLPHKSGCVDQIFTLRVLAEKAREFNSSFHLAFVDLSKAYGSVKQEALWKVLEKKYLLPGKLVHILIALNQDTKGEVKAHGKCHRSLRSSLG